MKDIYGDKIKVWGGEHVNVMFSTPGRTMPMVLTPKKARKLARRLNMAASAIEIAHRDTGRYVRATGN
jgi:hypothetical protein